LIHKIFFTSQKGTLWQYFTDQLSDAHSVSETNPESLTASCARQSTSETRQHTHTCIQLYWYI